jgi:hypothetical protein
VSAPGWGDVGSAADVPGRSSCDQFAETGNERGGRVGAVVALLMRHRAVVDFATQWFSTFRSEESDGDNDDKRTVDDL